MPIHAPALGPLNIAVQLFAGRVPDFVGVIDIGQGNFDAIFDANGVPFIYFDYGGGALGSVFTFPGHFNLCGNAIARLVVLSHWDQDHWRGAVVPGPAVHGFAGPPCTWLVPRQPVGVANAAFLTLLSGAGGANATVYVHPGVGNLAPTPQVDIIKCTGGGANHSGLAIRLSNPAGGVQRMLLPADCSYPHFPAAAAGNVVGLAGTHHGALGHGAIPAAVGGGGRVVYPAGRGGAYGHPRSGAENAHRAPGAGYAVNVTSTCGRSANGTNLAGPRGNVALMWPGNRGPNPGAAGQPAINAAAIAVLAAAAAAVWAEHAAMGNPPLGGTRLQDIAVAAAYRAISGFAPVANEYTGVANNAFGAALGGAAAGLAAARLRRVAVTAAVDLHANLINAIARAVASGHEALAPRVAAAAHGAPGGTIIAQSTAARNQAMAAIVAAATDGAINAALTAGPAPSAVDVAAAAAPGPPTANDVCDAVRVALQTAASTTHGAPGARGLRPSEAAPHVQIAVATPGFAHVSAFALGVAIAAAASIQPSMATNPEANAGGALGAFPNVATYDIEHRRAAVAAAAVYGGYDAGAVGAAATRQHIARLAVAAAMAAIGAAAGAKQPGCHRHPPQCGANLCRLTMHYAP